MSLSRNMMPSAKEVGRIKAVDIVGCVTGANGSLTASTERGAYGWVWARTGEGVYTFTPPSGEIPSRILGAYVGLGGTTAIMATATWVDSTGVVTIRTFDAAGAAADAIGTISVTVKSEESSAYVR